MKEFLIKRGVAFVSINVLEDKDAFAELAALGIRSVPIVRRGRDWADGQVLREVARAWRGVAWGGMEVTFFERPERPRVHRCKQNS